MSTITTRKEIRALAVKTETTIGTDAIGGTPVTADYISADFDVSLPQDLSDSPEVNGSMDAIAQIAGGIRPSVTIRVPLRGTAAAGVAPEWGRLMQACSYVETVQAQVGAPTAATAGTTTSITLATPFAATKDLYRGLPLVLSGDQSGVTMIQDYTAGRVATLAETLAQAPTVSTLAQVPACVIYRPTSDETLFKTVTVYAYVDGIRHRFVGMSGTWSLEMQAGKPGMLTFELRGVLLDAFQAVAFPSGTFTARNTPPLWIGGKSQLGRAVCRTDRLRWSTGVQLADIENPEAAQGFDPPFPVARQGQLELSPYATTTQSPTRFSNFQTGVSVPYAAMLGATAGNRCGLLLPNGRVTRFDMQDRNRLGVDAVTMTVDGADLSASLVVF